MEETKKNNHQWWKACLIILGAVVVLFGLYLGLAYILKKVNNSSPESAKTTTTSSAKISDKNVIGKWDTGCLVPDPNSPWAERHTFVFESNGTATHTRSTGDSCLAELKQDHKEVYNVTIPASGQINLVPTKDYPDEPSIYDIYNVSGNTLLLGHGFCNCTNAGSTNGGATESGRINRLNEFLKYQKSQ